MKTPGGGGKNPGMQKSPAPMKSPQKPVQKPAQKPVQRTAEKPAYTPSPKPQQKPQQKPPRKEFEKPQRDPGTKRHIAMLDRFKNRQGAQQADAPADSTGAGSTEPSGSGGRRRSCCLGCTIYALAAPLLISAALVAIF